MSYTIKWDTIRACRVLRQHRSTQRKMPVGRADEDRLVADMIELARQYGRYGYRRIAALLRDAGWHVNDKRVERLWRREGLKIPMKQPKEGRLWLNDGSCVRLRPEYRNHVWSYDFVHCRTDDGKAFRTLKEQCTHRHRFESIQHATRVIGDWISFYNNRRPHQALAMRTPAEAFRLAA